MPALDYRTLLKNKGLKDTVPRRSVLRILKESKKSLSIENILSRLEATDQSVGLVTVYRVIDALERSGLVHRHAKDTFSLCSLPESSGHHLLLHCTSCDSVQETHDEDLCKRENILGKRFGFRPSHAVQELLGICSSCR